MDSIGRMSQGVIKNKNKKRFFGVWLINIWWRKHQMTKLGLVNGP